MHDAPPEPPIEREETLAIMGALSDILFEMRRMSAVLLGDEGEEEEDEP